MEVKIGVQFAPRELSLESNQTPAQVEATVTEALASGGTLSLVDEKGRRVIVPVEKLADEISRLFLGGFLQEGSSLPAGIRKAAPGGSRPSGWGDQAPDGDQK